jgi:galactofuranosylgalactofuranosylrhamnosyl-N-acetylglucosaminyl-diphospho-decaprenol beta-1,5/1,6-galactofuranosyltransferase
LTDTVATPAGGPAETAGSTNVRVVHRTIMRPDQEIDIRPLYVGGVSGFGATQSESSAGAPGDTSDDKGDAVNYSSAEKPSTTEAVSLSGFGKITEEGALIHPERRLTFGTYFNAFPAGYWRRWTDFSTVRLQVTVRGQGTLSVYRSTAKGHVQREDSDTFDTTEPRTLSFDLPLKPFIDGGWYWYDVEAGEREAVVLSGTWGFETDRTRPGLVSIGITTFNRADFCVDQLEALAGEPEVLEILDQIYVVDQGTQRVKDEGRFPDVAARLGPQLRVIEQGNLGGSGGFSRAMDETVAKDDADYVLLLDDDIVAEPEGILRALAFADLAKRPTIVGGKMFSLYDRSVMHAYGETVDRWRWFWGAAPNTKHGHNFATRSLRGTQWLHRRVDVDYNGWWECLIPTKVIKEVGLSLPMFIKWDDAEFGLRAQEAGYPTVTLPGVAVWHVPWHEKDDTIDWQAYFHRRNRLIAALLHSPYDRGGRMVRESLNHQIKHLVSMQYSTVELRHQALEDVLAGPDRLHADLPTKLAEVNAFRKQFTDARLESDPDAFPPVRRKKPPRKGRDGSDIPGRLSQLMTAGMAPLRQLRPARDLSREYPEAEVAAMDAKWYRLARYDSAVVSMNDGTSAALYQRDPERFRELSRKTIEIHERLRREWPRLAEEYRAKLGDITSPEAWDETFRPWTGS